MRENEVPAVGSKRLLLIVVMAMGAVVAATLLAFAVFSLTIDSIVVWVLHALSGLL